MQDLWSCHQSYDMQSTFDFSNLPPVLPLLNSQQINAVGLLPISQGRNRGMKGWTDWPKNTQLGSCRAGIQTKSPGKPASSVVGNRQAPSLLQLWVFPKGASVSSSALEPPESHLSSPSLVLTQRILHSPQIIIIGLLLRLFIYFLVSLLGHKLHDRTDFVHRYPAEVWTDT